MYTLYIFVWIWSKFSSVQLLSRVRLFATPWIAACQASLSITNSWSLLRFTSIQSVMPSSHLILGRPLLLLPPVPPSTRVFSNESTVHMRWPKYWSFSFSIIPSNEHPGLISFRMDWLDPLAVQGTLKSLLQHDSSKASILQCSPFFTAQLSHQHMTTGVTLKQWLLLNTPCCFTHLCTLHTSAWTPLLWYSAVKVLPSQNYIRILPRDPCICGHSPEPPVSMPVYILL